MNGDNKGDDLDQDVASEDAAEETEETEETVVLDPGDDNFSNTVVEADVEALVAKMDSNDTEEIATKRAARKRLDELRERKDKDLDSTFNFNLDDEL